MSERRCQTTQATELELGYALFCLINEVPSACCLLVFPSMCLQDQTDRFWAES